MISQELMLGDWVMLNPDLKGYYPFAGKPCMVIGLHDDDGAIKIEYDNGKYFWTDAENDVIPIPLTPEILEKNGFIIKKKWTQIGNFGNSPLIVWHFEDDTILHDFKHELEIHQNDTGKVHVKIPCEYVHQLQHALKLCGIDKTIEL